MYRGCIGEKLGQWNKNMDTTVCFHQRVLWPLCVRVCSLYVAGAQQSNFELLPLEKLKA